MCTVANPASGWTPGLSNSSLDRVRSAGRVSGRRSRPFHRASPRWVSSSWADGLRTPMGHRARTPLLGPRCCGSIRYRSRPLRPGRPHGSLPQHEASEGARTGTVRAASPRRARSARCALRCSRVRAAAVPPSRERSRCPGSGPRGGTPPAQRPAQAVEVEQHLAGLHGGASLVHWTRSAEPELTTDSSSSPTSTSPRVRRCRNTVVRSRGGLDADVLDDAGVDQDLGGRRPEAFMGVGPSRTSDSRRSVLDDLRMHRTGPLPGGGLWRCPRVVLVFRHRQECGKGATDEGDSWRASWGVGTERGPQVDP